MAVEDAKKFEVINKVRNHTQAPRAFHWDLNLFPTYFNL